jgi:hypothetical protein
MRKILVLALSLLATGALADVNPDAPPAGASAATLIVLPQDGDDYSKLVARAAAGDTSVDFRAMRMAYLRSAARKRAGDIDELRKSLFDAARSGDDKTVRDAAIQLLSADYTDLYGQKFLRQACQKLGDEACAQQGHFVEFGLLTSITGSGDGKTCKTGWEVASIKEEYFVLAMLGTTLTQQALVGDCDLMNVVDEKGAPASYYFRIDAVLQDEESMFK